MCRENNLKNLTVQLPRGKLIGVTGVSGSGKSSLVFDVMAAEGHRKYVESLSTQARQALEKVRRPDVDFVEGLSPVLAIGQAYAGSSGPLEARWQVPPRLRTMLGCFGQQWVSIVHWMGLGFHSVPLMTVFPRL